MDLAPGLGVHEEEDRGEQLCCEGSRAYYGTLNWGDGDVEKRLLRGQARWGLHSTRKVLNLMGSHIGQQELQNGLEEVPIQMQRDVYESQPRILAHVSLIPPSRENVGRMECIHADKHTRNSMFAVSNVMEESITSCLATGCVVATCVVCRSKSVGDALYQRVDVEICRICLP